jgi:signal transduction histidine kinase
MLNEIEQKYSELLDVDGIFSTVLQQVVARARADVAAILLVDDLTGEAQWSATRGNVATHDADSVKIDMELTQALQQDGPQMFYAERFGFPMPSWLQPFVQKEKLRAVCIAVLRASKHGQGMILSGYHQEQCLQPNEQHELGLLAEQYALPITNVQLYLDLVQREKDMVTLSTVRVAVQEEERHRIAREIHDGLGQMLTAIKFNLEILEDTVKTTDDERERIRDMKELLDSVMKEARELSYNLMPSVLEDFGLAPALQLLTEQYGNRTGIKTTFHVHGLTGRVDSQIEVGLYRIAQESFNNISKHAHATEVNLQIICHHNVLRMVVEDNGSGMVIPQARTTGKSGIGLVSMRERAASFGGTFIIDSTLGGGTMLSVEVPLAKEGL